MDGLQYQRGVSLIEVLVAVFVFAIGLIGLAGLTVMASRSNQAAYLRTQVTFLANNLADRMRANSVGVWRGSYNGAYPVSTGSTTCDKATGCDPAAVAARDKVMWSRLLTSQLPGSRATLQCTGVDRAGYDPSGQLGSRPPYGGSCAMTITWTERGIGTGESNGDAAPQVFSWRLQP
ncbi:type IV pilus modification protein PilV [Dyella sp. EPa41]|uniref:type IV pilus modification protein PilV n=1 Tax=Dyella sp. EPa41 TaxID=1561194 RepID=UPI0019166C90|nr:type IV pilus modification protein PilV [Dyella sp. EPa41]